MSDDGLDTAYREGRLTKRAYVRQLLDQGVEMSDALARAEALVPAAPPPPEAGEDDGSGDVEGCPEMIEDLDINFVGDGYVIYQPSHKRMHSLNATAAVVLELCTGAHDADEIARLLQTTFELDEPPVAETRACLRSLRTEGLIR